MSSMTSFRRLSVLTGLIGILGASLSGCGGGGGVPPPIGNRSACAANTPHNDGRARWTVLVYMNAANNLQPFSLQNVGQMASVGSDSNVNIVVQWKQTSEANVADCSDCQPSFVGTHRYFLRKHSASDVSRIDQRDTSVLESDRLPDPPSSGGGTVDMGDWHVLQNFVSWGVQNYPSDNLALVIWDHGSGWRPVRRSANRLKPHFRAFSQDDETGNEIETQELPQALTVLGTQLDMLIFDASLEQMLEVAYEARSNARVMVGSEESPPGAGYPYDQWLNALKSSGKDPCDVGSKIVSTFVNNYPGESNITQSVLDMGKLQGVANALDAFGVALLRHVNDQASVIATARNNAQQYTAPYNDNKDLFNFADLIRTSTSQSDLQQAAVALQATLKDSQNGAILTAGHGSSGQNGSNGLAIYVPGPGNYLSSYNDLALTHNAPHWAQFLQAQTQ
jgi:hypothetical protein